MFPLMQPLTLGMLQNWSADKTAEAAASWIMALGCIGMFLAVVLPLAIFAFFIYCCWRICAKAGYTGALSLLNLIPGIGGIIFIIILAFGDWPIRRGLS